MTTLDALLERIQVEDLGRRASIRSGSTMTAQLVLRIDTSSLRATLNASEGLLKDSRDQSTGEFISQPAPKSALTHVLGRVLHTRVENLSPNEQFPEGRVWVEILMTARNVPFVVVAHRDNGPDFEMPSRNSILHLCGILECEPSFTLLRTFCPVKAKVERVWRFDVCPGDEEEYWGTIRLRLSSRLRKTDFAVVNSLEQPRYPYQFRRR